MVDGFGLVAKQQDHDWNLPESFPRGAKLFTSGTGEKMDGRRREEGIERERKRQTTDTQTDRH